MNKTVTARLNQGIDSFLRVALLLRRKEIDISHISMTTDAQDNTGLEMLVDENKIPVEIVLNYMSKLHDVWDIRVN